MLGLTFLVVTQFPGNKASSSTVHDDTWFWCFYVCARALPYLCSSEARMDFAGGKSRQRAFNCALLVHLGFTWRAPQDLSAFLEENFLTFMHDRLFFFKPRPRYNNLKKCNVDMAMHIGILLVLCNESRKVFQTYFHECRYQI